MDTLYRAQQAISWAERQRAFCILNVGIRAQARQRIMHASGCRLPCRLVGGPSGGPLAVRGRFVGGPLAVRGRFVGGSSGDPWRFVVGSLADRFGTPGGPQGDPQRTQMRPLAVRRGTPVEKVATAHACNRSSRRIAQLPDVRTRHGCSMHPPSRQQLRNQDAIQGLRAHRGSMVFCIRNSNQSVETPRARTVVRRDGITHASPSWETECALRNKP